jgi:hypothetical protein
VRLVSKSGDNNNASITEEKKQEPLKNYALLLGDCCVALCIDAEEEGCWSE